MTIEQEGESALHLLTGVGAYARTTAPEPSLLPHLVAQTDEDVAKILEEAAYCVGHFGQGFPAWPALWTATASHAAMRWGESSDVRAPRRQLESVLARRDERAALAIFQDSKGREDGDFIRATLSPLLPRALVVQVFEHDVPVVPSLGLLDVEAVRALLEAAELHQIPVADEWIDVAVTDDPKHRGLRCAHIVPFLPARRRMELAEESVRQLVGLFGSPSSEIDVAYPDFWALMFSRLGSFVSPALRRMQFMRLMDSVIIEEPWARWIWHLARADWPDCPHEDVLRAHPYAGHLRQLHVSNAAARQVGEILRRRFGLRLWAAPSQRAQAHFLDRERSERVRMQHQLLLGDQRERPRTLQADVLLGGQRVVDAFAANLSHVVEVSIGRAARVQLPVPFDEPDFPSGVDVLELPVWFRVDMDLQAGTLRLPRNQSRDSSAVRFRLTAPSTGRVVAHITVQRPGGGAVLLAALLVGDVVGSVEDALEHTPGIDLQVNVVAGCPERPLEASPGATVVVDGPLAVTELQGVPVCVDVSQLQSTLAKLVGVVEAAAARAHLDQTAIEQAMVRLALAGQGLRAEIGDRLGSLSSQPRLQVVSTCERDVLPLELIYEGPALSTTSKLCHAWRSALRERRCECPGGAPWQDVAPRRVCPLCFWGIAKVIERRTARNPAAPFHVFGERQSQFAVLGKIDAVLLGSSGRVGRDALDELFGTSRELFPGALVRIARNWSDWIKQVEEHHPELLVALPHSETACEVASVLRLGERWPEAEAQPRSPETELVAGGVTAAYVQAGPDRPGPIVLLLGCNTQFRTDRLCGFSGEFKENGAAITVATMGRLRADQAPAAAAIILKALVASMHGGATVGEALRDARARMLGSGLIMALLLVGNGDADWRLPGAPQ